MKFASVDESGGRDQSDVFVMVGLLIDAYRLRKTMANFDQQLKALFARHPDHPAELKTKAFINGSGNWNSVRGRLAGGMFVSALIQKKMQSIAGSKGLTVLVMDDNKHEMPNLSDGLYNADAWFDGLYQVRGRRRGVTIWLPRTASNRLDQIINTAFSIKSEHSSLIQVVDALSYVYRRKIELQTQAESYVSERAYYDELYSIIEPRREKLGQCPDCNAVSFYREIIPDGWAL